MKKTKAQCNYKRNLKYKKKISVKPNWIKECARYFTIFAVITLPAFLVAILVYSYIVKENLKYSAYRKLSAASIANNTEDELSTYDVIVSLKSKLREFSDEKNYLNNIHFDCNKRDIDEDGELGKVVITKDNHIIDCQSSFAMIVKDSESNVSYKIVYSDDQYPNNEKIESIYRDCGADTRAILTKGYIDGDYVYPLEINVVNDANYYERVDNGTRSFNGTDILKTYDETFFSYDNDFINNSDISNEYEEVVNDDPYNGYNYMIFLLGTRNNQDRSYKLLIDNMEQIKNGSKDYKKTNETFYKVDITVNEEIEISGEQYRVIWFYSINILGDYLNDILIGLGLIILLIIIFSLLLGTNTYNKLNTLYKLEKYRISTTKNIVQNLRNPIQEMTNNINNLIVNNYRNREDDANKILSNVSSMDKIISNILDLSKTQSNFDDLKFNE